MRVRVKAKLSGSYTPRPDYPLRSSSFAFSLATHSAAVLALALIRLPTAPVERPVYDQFIKPYEHKIILYDFRPKVPDVSPPKQVGRHPDPRGAELSRQTIVAMSPKPKSKQVLISIPALKIEIQQDLTAPLLVARMDSILPAHAAIARAPKKYVPPPPQEQPKLPIRPPILDSDSQPALIAAAPSAPETPPQRIAMSAVAPSRKAPEAPTAQAGNAPADIAIASLHPAENSAPLPDGGRPGRFSKAPTQGEAAGGETGTTTLTVPDLTIRNPAPKPAPAMPTEEIVYADRVRGVPLTTLSVPLRPASRMIPAAVEAKFKGRNVYTIVVPMERMTAYTGDWILWFSDLASKPGETPLIRAPVPLRKLERIDNAPPGSRTKERVQFAATLGKNGRLDGVTLLTKTTPAIQHAVFEDVTSWEFRPATCDGVAVAVDIVVEIPFSLPAALARGPME